MQKANGKAKSFLYGAVAGSVLGAAAALLLAPKSGKELRSDLAGSIQTAGEKTQQLAKKIGEQTGEWISKAKDVVNWKGSQEKVAASETEEELMPADAEVLVGQEIK